MNGIRNARKRKGLTMKELADIINCSESTISNYERGERQANYEALLKMADALDTTVEYLITGRSGSIEHDYDNIILVNNLHRQRVPLVGRVAAGIPIMAETDYEVYVDSPVHCDAALEVQGDSMAPTYLSGDIVYIKFVQTVDDGQVAVVLIDDEATLKHVYRENEGIMLTSDNPAYKPMHINGSDHEFIAIYGVPVGYTRMFKK